MTETINGVRRDLQRGEYQRVMRFYTDGLVFERAMVIQSWDINNLKTWGYVSVTFTSVGFNQYNENDSVMLAAMIESYRQARIVADEWSLETGKEIES